MTEIRGGSHLTALHPADDEPPGPPQDLAAERACLGAMLLSRDAIEAVENAVSGPEFYRPAHELIYNAIMRVHFEGEAADAITVGDELTRSGDLKRAGGQAYLHDLISSVPLTSNAGHYAAIVAEHAAVRRLQTHYREVLARLEQRGDTPIAELYEAAAEGLAKVATWLPAAADGGGGTWAPVDLEDALSGRDTGPRATIYARRDGKLLLYPGAVHSIAGEPGSGKTWAALVCAAQELDAGHPVLFIDLEDRAHTAVARLRALGVPDEQLRAGLRYVRPDRSIDAGARKVLDQAAAGTTLVIIDGITEAMALHGLSINENDDVAKWLHLIPNRLADLGPAVLQVDHVTKNSDTRGRYAIGAQHKLAGITGVAYKLLTIRSFGRGVKGHAKLVIDKDKHGDVGPNGATVADLHLDATDEDGRVYGWLDSPEASHDEAGHFRPTTLMQRVSDFLQDHGGSTQKAIRGGVRGKAESVVEAIDALIREGNVRVEPAPRGGHFHYLVTPFEDAS